VTRRHSSSASFTSWFHVSPLTVLWPPGYIEPNVCSQCITTYTFARWQPCYILTSVAVFGEVLRFGKIDSLRQFSGAWCLHLLNCGSLCRNDFLNVQEMRCFMSTIYSVLISCSCLFTSCTPLENVLRVTCYNY
jgi:hypothetical protein